MIRALLLVLAAASAASASSSLNGVVKDPNGQLIFDARILLLSQENRDVLYETKLKLVQGVFRIEPVEPGCYFLNVRALGCAPYEDSVCVARDEAADVGTVVVSVGRIMPDLWVVPVPISGRLAYTNPRARQTAPPTGPRELILREVRETWTSSVSIGPDDGFTLRDLSPGLYFVTPSWNGGYVKSIRLGRTETDNGILDLSRGYAGQPLTVLVSSGVCEVSGTVRRGDVTAAGAWVALVPEDREASRFPLFTTAGAGGTYAFVGIRPGEYTLAALDDEDSEEAVQSGGLGMYTGFTETIEIGEHEKLSVDLQQRPRL